MKSPPSSANVALYRWLCSPRDIAASPRVQADAALRTLCALIAARAPLTGALTLLFDGIALQFGTPDEASARWLSQVHAEPGTFDAGVSADASAPTPEALGFDLSRENLGLAVATEHRQPLAADRDRRPGEWKHPVVQVHAASFFVRLLSQRNLGLGEACIAGEFQMLRGSIHHLIGFFLVNRIDRDIALAPGQKAALLWQLAKWRATRSHNEDIAEHYDIGDHIMVPMLGATGCYSCGYMEHESDDLDRMQHNKIDLIFSKLRLRPGMRILDTGCGNGGMLVHAALGWGCDGEGFTNSFNMASLARRNARSNGVEHRVRIHHADFSLLRRYPDAHFDAIYEVGVWEHLPFADYAEVMRECHRILKPHGRMLIHSMGSHERKHVRDGYIQKYIFRDSNQVRLHLLLDHARRHDMFVADVENIGRHYHWTLWYWRRNLIEAYERDRSIGERDFRVMWYFLECGMAESRFGDGSVYQLLLYRDARDYRHTWRVDARIHDSGRGALRQVPLLMKPCDLNEHLHNDADAQGKAGEAVYRKPGVSRRLRHWLHTARQVTHR